MRKADATREKLLTHARRLMWAHGYSAISLRQVAQAAGVDVALISRYFGGKRGLFEATLEGAFEASVDPTMSREALVEQVVDICITAPRDGLDPSSIRMMLMNAHDEEVGDLVRAAQNAQWQGPLSLLFQSKERAALFMAAVLGMSVAEKSLHLEGIAPVGSSEYEAQMRHMLQSALNYEG